MKTYRPRPRPGERREETPTSRFFLWPSLGLPSGRAPKPTSPGGGQPSLSLGPARRTSDKTVVGRESSLGYRRQTTAPAAGVPLGSPDGATCPQDGAPAGLGTFLFPPRPAPDAGGLTGPRGEKLERHGDSAY